MDNYTYRKHSPIYYPIRTCVRFVFWTGLAGSLIVGGSALVDHFYGDDRPECDVTTNVDFTWTPNTTTPIDLATCQHPTGIVLESDRTWRWYEPDFDN